MYTEHFENDYRVQFSNQDSNNVPGIIFSAVISFNYRVQVKPNRGPDSGCLSYSTTTKYLSTMSGYYEQYKFYTGVAVSWLCQTAKDNGSTVVGRSDINKKERKKDQGNGKASYSVTTEEILKQVAFLSRLTTNFVAPPLVGRAFERAVELRKVQLDWHKKQGRDSTSNQGHEYFISVLEKVRDLLRTNTVQQSANTPGNKGKGKAKEEDILQNRFSQLTVLPTDEDEDIDLRDIPESLVTRPSDAVKNKFKFVHDVSEEEDLKMRWTFLVGDAEKVLEYMGEIWDQAISLGAPPISTVAAALITESATVLLGHREQLFKQAVNEATTPRAKAANYGLGNETSFFLPEVTLIDTRNALERSKMWGSYLIPLVKFETRHAKNRAERSQNRFDAYCKEEEILIRFFMELRLEMKMRKEKWETNRGKDPKTKATQSSHTDKFEWKGLLLSRSLDELSRVLYAAISKGGDAMKLQPAFAAKALLRTRSNRSFQYDPKPLEHAFETLTEWGQADEYARAAVQYPIEAFRLNRRMEALHQWATSRDIEEFRAKDEAKFEKNQGIAKQGQYQSMKQDEYIRFANSTLCGKLHFAALILAEDISLRILNVTPNTFSMCWLYEALKRDRRVARHSKFDCIIHLHARSELYLTTGALQSVEKMQKGMRLGIGHSAASIAQISREGYPVIPKKSLTGKKPVLQTSPVISTLREYLYGEKPFIHMLAELEKDMNKARPQRKQISRIDSGSMVEFLTDLHRYLQPVLNRLTTPYLAAACESKSMFMQMSNQIGPIAGEVAPDEPAWKRGTSHSIVITDQVLRELVHEEKLSEENARRERNSIPLLEGSKLRLTSIAADVFSSQYT